MKMLNLCQYNILDYILPRTQVPRRDIFGLEYLSLLCMEYRRYIEITFYNIDYDISCAK